MQSQNAVFRKNIEAMISEFLASANKNCRNGLPNWRAFFRRPHSGRKKEYAAYTFQGNQARCVQWQGREGRACLQVK